MADPPRYPSTSDDHDTRDDTGSQSHRTSRTKLVLVAGGVAMFAVMIGLHLAGVAPH